MRPVFAESPRQHSEVCEYSSAPAKAGAGSPALPEYSNPDIPFSLSKATGSKTAAAVLDS
jgi:hypothetical protein